LIDREQTPPAPHSLSVRQLAGTQEFLPFETGPRSAAQLHAVPDGQSPSVKHWSKRHAPARQVPWERTPAAFTWRQSLSLLHGKVWPLAGQVGLWQR
jgi:hypothetical protein